MIYQNTNSRLPVRVLLSVLLIGLVFIPFRMQAQKSNKVNLLLGNKDYRYCQSSVKNQVDRGTCTAFAICGALETFPGVAADLSEQYLYSMVKMDGWGKGRKVYKGESLYNYLKVLGEWGIIHEKNLPYNPKGPVWQEDWDYVDKLVNESGGTGPLAMLTTYMDYRKYRLKEYQYTYMYKEIEGDDQSRIKSLMAAHDPSDVAYIKQLLNEGNRAIVASYTLYLPDWGFPGPPFHEPVDIGEVVRVNVMGKEMDLEDARLTYPEIGEEVRLGKVPARLSDPDVDNYGGHAVVIVGYNHNGFIIKNSWGEEWGTDGYAVVSFDLHRIFCTEAVLFKQMDYGKPWADINDKQGPYSQLILKSTPGMDILKPYLDLNVYSANKYSDPELDYLTFKIYLVEGNSNTKSLVKEGAVLMNEIFYSSGRRIARIKDFAFGKMKSDESLMVETEFKFKNNPRTYKKAYYGIQWETREYDPAIQTLMREK